MNGTKDKRINKWKHVWKNKWRDGQIGEQINIRNCEQNMMEGKWKKGNISGQMNRWKGNRRKER